MAGQVRRISQHLILFSNPPTLWEGVIWDTRGSEIGGGLGFGISLLGGEGAG